MDLASMYIYPKQYSINKNTFQFEQNSNSSFEEIFQKRTSQIMCVNEKEKFFIHQVTKSHTKQKM